MDLAAAFNHPKDQLLSLQQNAMEKYVEKFLEVSHRVPWNESNLKVCFWSGLDNSIFRLMLVEKPPVCWPNTWTMPCGSVLPSSQWDRWKRI